MDLRALYGTDIPPVQGRRLVAGDAAVTLESGQLRHLTVAGVEAIRAVSFLVRDRDWGTVTPRIDDLTITDGCNVTYRATYDMGTGRIVADVALRLRPDGMEAQVTARCSGQVWTNRAGFTVLHPIDGVAGAPVKVEHADGSVTDGYFPDLIAPWQPFQQITGLIHRAGDRMITCRLTGDVFEMEDQRQWGDASFKTYNRPLALPWPYQPDAVFRQAVRVTWQPAQDVAPPAWVPPTRTAVFPQTALVLTGRDAGRAARTPGDLRNIDPSRILCHLDAAAGPLGPDLAGFARLQAEFPDLPMDLELIALCPPGGDLEAEFAAYAQAVRDAGLRAASVMVTPSVDRQSTPPGSEWPPCPPIADIHAAARRAFPDLPLGGGAASFFPELNRKPALAGDADFVTHGLCPIVHAADDLSVIETLQAVPHILASGRGIIGARDYRLGPSTIAMRQNPYGSRTIPNPDRDRICMADDDPRQDGAFAAAWTLGLATAMAGAGLTVWTPAALYGPRGLIREDGTARPLAALVAALAACAGQPVLRAEVTDHRAELDLRDVGFLANLCPQPDEAADLVGFGWRQTAAKDLHSPAATPRS
ncbi:hypothetical protein [Paracoccus indicus]|uniref:hypothetical protein n=1 Tax=Paracoccus indicus TaxID=2079229 RepID=UPI003AAAC19B